jgi:Terminase RNaseH-like domain
MTEIVRDFLKGRKENAEGPKIVIAATWDDVPHLTAESKAELFASIPSYQRDARTKGIPQLGSGAIYQVEDKDILVRPFDIPKHWPRGFGLDVGWNRTAAIWGAQDLESGILYLYSEHYMAHEEPHVHSHAIKGRGAWVPGWIDPASKGRSQRDGSQLIELYCKEGLNIQPAVNAVEAGIYACEQLMHSGKLKAFTSLSNWYSELRLYRRDKDGKIVKENDHAMDAMRYLVMSGLEQLRREPAPIPPAYAMPSRLDGQTWMQ